jgi:hypothetical protein
MQRSLTDAAQQLICNQQVMGSNPIAGSIRNIFFISGLQLLIPFRNRNEALRCSHIVALFRLGLRGGFGRRDNGADRHSPYRFRLLNQVRSQ